ncbi:TPA: hypothetical protein JLT64_003293 [Escherichia coli]|nr:hypothetical protein [Escherichia coli]
MSEINYQEGHETAGQAKPVAWRYRYVKKDVTDFQGKPWAGDWKYVPTKEDCNDRPNYEIQALFIGPPVPVTSEGLVKAVRFYEQVKRENPPVETGAWKDAVDWVLREACCAAILGKAENQTVHGNQAAESNRGNEWTGNPDIDNAIIMLDRIDTLENCDDDRIEAVKAVLRRLAGNSPVIPDGWVIVPKKLTAENGAKGVLSGEFSETTFISCPECFGDDDCDTCDGSGRIEIKVPVTWTTIKSIWDKGIAYFAVEPRQEVNRG